MEAHEAHEVGETVAETAHHGGGNERFRRVSGIFIGVVGMLLAIASLAGENAMKETVNFNIRASDAYAFYQARNVRQTSYALAADTLDALLESRPDLPPAARAPIEQRAQHYRATVQRYDSDPKAGNGKKELLEQAKDFEAIRDHAQAQDINFDYARAFYQIAILLGSVSIVGASRPLLWLAGGVAAAATLLAVNGFLLLVDLPFS